MKTITCKFFRLIFCTLLLLVTTHSMAAQAQVSEGGDNTQSPIQVIVQIVVTAIALRVLNAFDLP